MKHILIFLLIAACLVTCSVTQVTAADTNTVTSSGTVTIDKTPPTASAPSIVINNNDVCKSAYSAGVQTQILGIASGITVTDKNCERLKLARSLYGMGMKVAAVSTLCQDARVFDAMLMAGTPCPYDGMIGEDAKAGWETHTAEQPVEEKEEESMDETTKQTLWATGGVASLLLLLLL